MGAGRIVPRGSVRAATTGRVGPRSDVPVAVGVGTNLGDREARVAEAIRVLRTLLEDVRTSSVYETEPRFLEDQPPFLNLCVTGRTRLTARQLLSQLQDAERAAGRTRSGARYGPRTLDLDLLLYGDQMIDEPELEVPHPGIRERAFVLVPLAEVAGDWIVPASRGAPAMRVADLAACAGTEGVRRRPGKGDR